MANAYLEAWNGYINTNEVVLDGMGIVQWWGVHVISLFPESDLTLIFYSCMEAATQHGSLLHAITLLSSSSVLSKRGFSSAGITISKWCNCLNADIVEALQCLKAVMSG